MVYSSVYIQVNVSIMHRKDETLTL